MEQSDNITTPPTVYASASLTPPNEIDINNQAWKEAWRFANQITYSPRLQTARGDLEEGTYRANLDKDVVELRELEVGFGSVVVRVVKEKGMAIGMGRVMMDGKWVVNLGGREG